MKAIRDRAEARWLPSRHCFALFRLVAFLRLRSAQPEPRPGLLLTVDRHQSQFEHYSLAVWVTATVTCFTAATLFASRHVALALMLAVPVTLVGMQMVIVGCGLVVDLFSGVTRLKVDPVGGSSVLMMTLFLGSAAFIATSRTWARWVAWQVLALVALNALAAVLVFLLRGPIDRIERAYDPFGGPPSVK
jgi:hypothetical protein